VLGGATPHLAHHFGLVTLGHHLDRSAQARQLGNDDVAGVRPGREQDPRAPAGRVADLAPRRAVHRELLDDERLGVDAGHLRGRLDAHDEVEIAGLQQFDQRGRRRHAQQEFDVGLVGAELPEHVGVVADGGGVDHARVVVARLGRW
jgi:hypothetical protein